MEPGKGFYSLSAILNERAALRRPEHFENMYRFAEINYENLVEFSIFAFSVF